MGDIDEIFSCFLNMNDRARSDLLKFYCEFGIVLILMVAMVVMLMIVRSPFIMTIGTSITAFTMGCVIYRGARRVNGLLVSFKNYIVENKINVKLETLSFALSITSYLIALSRVLIFLIPTISLISWVLFLL